MLNPRYKAKSDAKFTLWDDCMSAPWLMARVARHRSIELEWMDDKGVSHELACDGNEKVLSMISHMAHQAKTDMKETEWAGALRASAT